MIPIPSEHGELNSAMARLRRRVRAEVSMLVAFTAMIILCGCETVLKQPEGYRFELVGAPMETQRGTIIWIQLVHADGSPVKGAKVYAEQWKYIRHIPVRRELVPLSDEGEGIYSYTSKTLHAGDVISLAAGLGLGGELKRAVISTDGPHSN